MPCEEVLTRHRLPAHHPQPQFLHYSPRRHDGVETFVYYRGTKEERCSTRLPFYIDVEVGGRYWSPQVPPRRSHHQYPPWRLLGEPAEIKSIRLLVSVMANETDLYRCRFEFTSGFRILATTEQTRTMGDSKSIHSTTILTAANSIDTFCTRSLCG